MKNNYSFNLSNILADEFDQGIFTRIPGGTNSSAGIDQQQNFACFGLVVRRNTTAKEIEVLTVPYDSVVANEKRLKKDEGAVFDESEEGLLRRKVAEETGVVVKGNVIFLGKFDISDNKDKNSLNRHFKYVYLITEYNSVNIHRNKVRGNKTLPPRWVPLSLLDLYLYNNHRWMIKYLKEYLDEYRNTVIPRFPPKGRRVTKKHRTPRVLHR